MTNQATGGDSGSIIDDFVGQGAAAAGETCRPERTATTGCAILTEFTGQGNPAMEVKPSTKPAERSPSQGCEAITTFSDEGFVPVDEKRNGAGVKPPPQLNSPRT